MLAGLLPQGAGTAAIAAAAVRAPALLAASPVTLWGNCEALRQLLGLAPEAAARLVARQPRLLLNSRWGGAAP